MNDFQIFADNYTSADFGRIKYDWNGKYGNEFHDSNYDFRMKICEFLIPQIARTKNELIQDLFIETAKSSAGTWSIYSNIHIYGQELLNRDWKKYLDDYIRGCSYGFDAYLALGRIEINKIIALQILAFLEEKSNTAANEREKKTLDGFIKRFRWLANK